MFSLNFYFVKVYCLYCNLSINVCRYTEDMELDDAVHTAILTLKEGYNNEDANFPLMSRNPIKF